MQPKYKNYKNLQIWQKSQIIFEMVCEDIKQWGKDNVAYIIANQLIRPSSSISTNIAEGYGRGGPKEFEQYLRISRGSLSETDNWLYKAKQQTLISDLRYSEYTNRIEEISKMIAAFIHSLRDQHKKI